MPKLKFDSRRKSYAALDRGRTTARAGQGGTYWNAICEAAPTAHNSVTFAFPAGDDASFSGAVGMLPPDMANGDSLGDWLGYQTQSVAVWFNGNVRLNGTRKANVAETNVAQGICFELEHNGTLLKVSRNGELLKCFSGIPPSWRFAALRQVAC